METLQVLKFAHKRDHLNFTVGLVAQEEDYMLDSVSADGPPQ